MSVGLLPVCLLSIRPYDSDPMFTSLPITYTHHRPIIAPFIDNTQHGRLQTDRAIGIATCAEGEITQKSRQCVWPKQRAF